MHRRSFIQIVSGAALGQAPMLAAPQGTRLGFATYSIRSQGWKAMQILDYAAAQKVDTIQLSSGDLGSLDETNIREIKSYAGRLGILVEPTFDCICPLSNAWNAKRQNDPVSYILEAVRVARLLGSPNARCAMGNEKDPYGSVPISAMMENTIKTLRSVRTRVQDAGVKLALENHGEMRARELAALIEEA